MSTTRNPREIVAAAVRAGQFDAPADEALDRAIASGADVPFEKLDFDSLGWMEFCISVELESGLELTPTLVSGMRSLHDVEAWLAARLNR
ncbi:phosphopantetheine-binding protein [Methylopila sp. M107]|uniref:phosphopantetheine-binding protein n=1 Tax=Methylopila sp. M107 TaxID=1101190 RepID=UPI000371A213|nr:phosphopantetheine-binding protein [Methylopila sp. M107]